MKKYSTIMADPPWPYRGTAVVGNGGRGKCNGRASSFTQVGVRQHYPTMSIKDLAALPVLSLAKDNSHLYLWTTNSFMVEAHELAKAWGFTPKTILTWVKVCKNDTARPSMKTGYYYRSASEHILFAIRGRMRLCGPCRPTAYLHTRLPHSVKPDFFFNLAEEQSPGPYLELFARQLRKGWDQWGNEIESNIDLTPNKILETP